ncbi:hypothetical protein TNCV_3197031 [Trichonephila clavipes]|nr:hypothetical protein TNCV_3197031 [Trichonephila clavipes]
MVLIQIVILLGILLVIRQQSSEYPAAVLDVSKDVFAIIGPQIKVRLIAVNITTPFREIPCRMPLAPLKMLFIMFYSKGAP